MNEVLQNANKNYYVQQIIVSSYNLDIYVTFKQMLHFHWIQEMILLRT